MSTSFISPIPNTTWNYISTPQTSKPAIQPRHFLFLIPTIAGIATGILVMPNFALGFAAGMGIYAVHVITTQLLRAVDLIENVKERRSKYEKILAEQTFETAFIYPIVEEALFRGGLQTLLTYATQSFVPATAAVLLGPHFTIAATVSVVATGIFFGAIHYFNKHKHAGAQVIHASLGGIVLGTLNVQFGIGAAFAAHIANNTLDMIVSGFKIQPPTSDTSLRPLNKRTSTPLPV